MSTTPTVLDSAQEQVNGRLYRQANLVRGYTATKLYPSEATAFVRYRDDFVGQRVLDLGCGAGRLATYLRPLTDHYSGVDVSPHMVDYCRRTFPGLEFHQADMRELTPIGDAYCQAVLAISNLFDAVSHADRLRTLSEARRVLKPDGLLVFSTHNRNHDQAGTGPQLEFHRNPLTQARLFADFLQASLNHRRYKLRERSEPDYALINDSGNNYQNLHYYIARDVQAQQLEQAGFQLLECLDPLGGTLGPSDDDSLCPSILYIARSRA